MTYLVKDPAATLDYRFDWSNDYLQADETLLSASFAVTPSEENGLSLSQDSFSDLESWVTASAGLVGHTYRLTCTISTNQGRTDERSITLRIQER